MDTLFTQMEDETRLSHAPLAVRMRPRTLDELVGQQEAVGEGTWLRAAIENDTLSSILLYGPAGTGKTSLARVIAHSTHATFVEVSAIGGTVSDLRKVIAEADERLVHRNLRTILFIDEIHRLNRSVEEVLYPAMEDYALDIIIGKGPSARSIRIDLPRFTLVGATTRAGQLSAPLRDRFGVVFRLELYTPEELSQIVTRSAGILGIPCEAEGAMELARRSRGTPRIANRFLKRVRDFAQVQGSGVITPEIAAEALERLEVDYLGLDRIDRRILSTIIQNYAGGPVGLDTIAAAVGEESVTLEDVYEPYLMQIGFLTRTPRGRCVTRLAYNHLHLEAPDGVPDAQMTLSF